MRTLSNTSIAPYAQEDFTLPDARRGCVRGPPVETASDEYAGGDQGGGGRGVRKRLQTGTGEGETAPAGETVAAPGEIRKTARKFEQPTPKKGLKESYEIARKINIPEGTVLAHAKRHGWTQQIQAAAGQLTAVQSDAIAPVQSVPQSLAAILSERKERTKLGLSKYTAEAAEEAALHRDKLRIAGKVKDVAGVHKTLWPGDNQREEILQIGVLIGEVRPAPLEEVKPAK